MMHRPAAAEPTVSPAQEFCTAVGLDDGLGSQLLREPGGQPFAPATLDLTGDPAALPELMGLLGRAEPVGGAEPLVRANQRRLREAYDQRLYQRLTAHGHAVPLRPFLADLQAELRRLRDQVGRQQHIAEESFEQAHTSLRAWQDASREPQGLFGGLTSWVLGGPGRMALPQAVGLWNEREHLAAQRLGWSAATTLLSQLPDELGTLLDNQQAAAHTTRAQAGQARQHLAELARANDSYGPWSWHSDLRVMAVQLGQRADRERLAGQLVGLLAEIGGVERIGVVAGELARAEASRLLNGLDFADLIEAEAEAVAELLDGADPLVLVGQQLITLVDRRPGWRLVRGARPRGEIVQITADGRPLFRLDGLQTAAYAAPLDRLGFLQVELEVSVDELWLMREGEAAFDAAMTQRNFYVLDDLAAAWEERRHEAAQRRETPGLDESEHHNGTWRYGAPGYEAEV